MPTLEVNGVDIEVDESFLNLSPEQQSATVDEIASSIQLQDRDRSAILPKSRNSVTGQTEWAVPGIIKGIMDAPGQMIDAARTGVFDPNTGRVSDDVIGASTNAALVFSPAAKGSVFSKAPPKLKSAPPLKDGQAAAVAADRIGVQMPRAVVSDKSSVNQLGKTVTSIPIAGAPLRNASKQAVKQLDDAATRTQQGYGTGSAVNAGGAVRAGVEHYAKKEVPGAVSDAYRAVDELIDPSILTPISNTQQAAQRIMAQRNAANLSTGSSAIAKVQKALDDPNGMSYEGIKRLRTELGDLKDLDSRTLAQMGHTAGEVKQIYAALSTDLRVAASRSGGPKALEAFNKANTIAAKAANDRKALDRIFGHNLSDEGMIAKIEAMASGTGRANVSGLLRVRKAVSKQTWDETASAVLAKMGKATDGSFSPDKFVTQWNKMPAGSRKLLFNGQEDLYRSLNDIAQVSTRFKKMNEFANPSGTGQHLMTGLTAGSASAALFEPTAMLVTVGTIGGGRLLSNMLSKPASARKLAQWVKTAEQMQRSSSPTVNRLFVERTQSMAGYIAEQTGAPTSQVIQQLFGGLNRGVAENGGDEVPAGYRHPQPYPNGQHRQLLPGEL